MLTHDRTGQLWCHVDESQDVCLIVASNVARIDDVWTCWHKLYGSFDYLSDVVTEVWYSEDELTNFWRRLDEPEST